VRQNRRSDFNRLPDDLRAAAQHGRLFAPRSPFRHTDGPPISRAEYNRAAIGFSLPTAGADTFPIATIAATASVVNAAAVRLSPQNAGWKSALDDMEKQLAAP
jgi:hypothetical protein